MKSIWHTPDEPWRNFCDVVLINSENGECEVFLSPFNNISFVYDKWAYVVDLVLVEQKLETAVVAINKACEMLGVEPEIDTFNILKTALKEIGE